MKASKSKAVKNTKVNAVVNSILPTTPKLEMLEFNYFKTLPKIKIEFRSYGIALMDVLNVVTKKNDSYFPNRKVNPKALRAFQAAWKPFGFHKGKGRFDDKGLTAKEGNNTFLVNSTATIQYDLDLVKKYKKLILQKSTPTAAAGSWSRVNASIS